MPLHRGKASTTITNVYSNYPHQDHAPEPGQVRASAHTDYGAFTLLVADNAPGGLQVLNRDGSWQSVSLPPHSFVVNLGDLMQRWTNDCWKSTMHRVVNPPLPEVDPRTAAPSNRRQSIAFFFNMNKDALIECIETCKADGEKPKYEPILAGEHLLQKHAAAMGMPY